MSPVQNVWRQMVQRRLWPVAILMVAGVAAVPLTLAKDPEPVAAPPVTPVETENSDLATQPIVAMASVEESSTRRRVLGARKNPFVRPPKQNASDTSSNASSSVVTKTKRQTDTSDDASTGSGGGTTTPGTGSTPVPTEPAPAPKTYAVGELTVRFGSSEDTARRSVKKLQPLPSAEEPVLVYMGLLKDGKTAVFMIDHGVSPVGDGDCRPSPEECETVRLRAGETEFFDIKDETGNVSQQYQLDLIKIHKGTSASAAKASRSVKAAASVLRGRPALRTTVGQAIARLP